MYNMIHNNVFGRKTTNDATLQKFVKHLDKIK